LDDHVLTLAQPFLTARTSKRDNVKVPMVKTTIIREPFSKIAIDIVGPLSRTKKGNKYILTVIDEGTRYPEAFPLPSIEAERMAQSLVQLFSRVGVARVILSDQGSNWLSNDWRFHHRYFNIIPF
jgi:hypothetical protein